MPGTRNPVIAITVCAILSAGCQQGTDQGSSESRLAGDLQALLDEAVATHEGLPAIVLHVEAPTLGLSWGGAAGLADPADGTPMTPKHPLLVASNTKTFISASVLRLWEEGRLGLDDPISAHLSEEHLEILRGDGYRTDEITMLTTVAVTRGGPDAYGEAQIPGAYRMGVVVEEIDGLECYHHGGWWGTTAAYLPDLDVAFACAVTRRQERAVREEVVGAALALVRHAMASSS